MKKVDIKVLVIIIMSSFCLFTLKVTAQDEIDENLFWTEDSLLTQQIDSLGEDVVLKKLRSALSNAESYCTESDDVIHQDSASSWITLVRWSVITKDKESLDMAEGFSECISQGERGQWQFYLSAITKWGLYQNKTEGFTMKQKLDLILPYLLDDEENTRVFYEERMIDLGVGAIPEIIEWAQNNLIPRMDELNRDMLSEEDLKFTMEYDRFVMIFSLMFQSEKDKNLLSELSKSEDKNVRRFAEDTLDLIDI